MYSIVYVLLTYNQAGAKIFLCDAAYTGLALTPSQRTFLFSAGHERCDFFNLGIDTKPLQ